MALECVDGGMLKNVHVENINATNTGNAIFLRLGRRINLPVRPVERCDDPQREGGGSRRRCPMPAMKPPVPDVKAPHNVFPSSIAGLPGHPVSNVVLENIQIIYAGGGTPERAQVRWNAINEVPEQEGKYPEFSMFGELPAWGFYVRHAEGIEFRNCRISLKNSDYRPALVFDDVRDLRLNKMDLGPISGKPVVVMHDVNVATSKNVKYPRGIGKQDQVRRTPE